MLDIFVPVERCVVVGVRASLAQTEGLGFIVEIVDEELALCTSRSEDVRAEWIELNRLNGAGVLVDLLNKSVAVDIQYSCHVHRWTCVLTLRPSAASPHPTTLMPRCLMHLLSLRGGVLQSAGSRRGR